MSVYKKYNQEQLNNQFDNRFYVTDFQDHLNNWERLSKLAAGNNKLIKDLPYGSGFRESLDIFPSLKEGSKTLVFIHGGYWQKFDKSLFHFIANAFSQYDITTVIINYPLAPVVSMDKIVESCRKAVDWVYSNISQWNGNPDEIYVAGHSAGGHLAAMLMVSDNETSNQNFIKGICTMSGLFNLTPIQLSNINDALQMNKEMAISNSPSFKLPGELCPLLITVGGEETTEFKDQSQELYKSWGKNKPVNLIELPGLNHFSILSEINNPHSLLHLSICKLMGLK